MGWAIMDIALSMLPILVVLSPCFWWIKASTWSLLLQDSIKPIALYSPNWAAVSLTLRSSRREKTTIKLFKCAGAPLSILHLIGLVKGMSPFPHVFSRLLLEWISKLIKLFRSIVYLLIDYTFYLPFRSLLSLKSGYKSWGNWGTSILLCLASPSEKVIAGLAHNEGLISSVGDRKGNIWGGGGESASFAKLEILLPPVR